jgi:phosphopantothenoylcysteine decarboxylase/phosphopantothenate--cysteine ligase
MEPITLLQDKHILLGVTGSIACYKAVDLASKLTQAGAHVDVILTESAARFVTPLAFQSVTGRGVYTGMWEGAHGAGLPTHIAHVGLAESADLLLIAPATADSLARLAGGFASDMLSILALAARCPLVIAPAMDGAMYEHPAVQANVETLRGRGAIIVEPESGRFASGLSGRGRLPETPTLIGVVRAALGQGGVLAGRHVVVTSGGTREAIDPVRYITNRSSGKQGHALAQAAADAGAHVTLITAARGLPVPYGAVVLAVDSARSMHDAVLTACADADMLIMAAAVADFRPEHAADHKIKKTDGGLTIHLMQNPDILLSVREARAASGSPRVVVGFAAESDRVIEHGREKLIRKGVDLLVVNDIRAADAGFDADTNRVTLLMRESEETLPLMSKAAVSEVIIARAAALLAAGQP